MRSLAIEFEGDNGARLNFNKVRSGFGTQVQKALMNLATERGSDRFSPTRGTDLLRRAISGRLRGVNNKSRNAAGFAAIDTLFFQRGDDSPNDVERTSEIKLVVASVTSRQLNLQVQMVSTTGETVGIVAAV